MAQKCGAVLLLGSLSCLPHNLQAEDFPAKLGKWVGWQLVWTSGGP